ncbi:hypothetical protein ACFHYQ_06230 [Sphaerimonospora cavernae]|uniref:TetR family transcriptional regulator n=1 Tax=Sphaerimonospora cavernae TaxID=1740611 RepID=A0ABV6U0F7_9ACTN
MTPRTSRSTTSPCPRARHGPLVYHYFGGKRELYVAALRSATGELDARGLDWLEHRDVDRAGLERMLVDQMVAMLMVAAEHDQEVGRLLTHVQPDRRKTAG